MKDMIFRAQSIGFALLLVICLVLNACQDPAPTQPIETPAPTQEATQTDPTKPAETQPVEFVDLAGDLKLDMNSDSFKLEVTVKTYVDGDTTHFNVPASVVEGGVLKARYLGVNTPESTGKIEEYGKKASNFTKEALKNAAAILIESDDANLNVDSTGGRYLVWVWYKPSADADWRNLNVELLQNGLAIASNSANNRYGSVCTAAIAQARAFKLNVYSGQKDPGFYYGDSVELTLRELRCNIDQYNGIKVAFEGGVAAYNNYGVYVESYDEDTDMYFGIYVYYGYSLTSGVDILTVGNKVRIVGTVQFYENGGTYQIAGLTYRTMKPDDPGNIQKLDDGYEAAYKLVDAQTFLHGMVEIEDENGLSNRQYAELAMNSSISMKDLKVDRIYTTNNEESSSFGAMTITCLAPGGETVTVRTVVLYDADGTMIKQSAYEGKTIDVKGIVDYYAGSYQIKVLSPDDIIVH